MTGDLAAGKPIAVLLVDDHPVVRAGYRRLLESTPDIRIAGEAGDGETGYALYRNCKPDVVVLDLSMSGIGGLETIRRIKTSDASAHILVFSMHSYPSMVQRVLKMGAEGYLTKQGSPEQLIQAVRQVRQGRLYVDPALAADMVGGMVHNNAFEDPLVVLSRREFQLFKLMAEGYSVAQIADIISISPKTVGVHHANIMRKLSLQNTTQLVRLAVHYNIIAT
jgi:two-component system invasion response regulator UvrY